MTEANLAQMEVVKRLGVGAFFSRRQRMAETRINVIGASGSGTSTVGRSLASTLSIPHFESDDYYHAPSDPPFQNRRADTDRYELICRDLLSNQNWVLSGGVSEWSPVVKFTCIVFLYVPTPVRMERLRRRESHRFGERILKGGDMYTIHEEFIDWASRYDAGDIDGKTLARHEAYLKDQDCKVLEFRGVLPVEHIAKMVHESIRAQGNIG